MNVDFPRAMQILKENLTVVFDALNANIVSGFTNRISSNLSGGMKAQLKLIELTGSLTSNQIFQESRWEWLHSAVEPIVRQHLRSKLRPY